jgi:ubiquitin carboxyl-terminal hydrolase 9/24
MRYVFGMNEQIRIGSAHLNQLWQLCCAPADREELMVFIASASGMSSPRSPHVSIHQPLGPLPQGAAAVDERLSPAIADDVCAEAFLSLFCAADFQLLGESAYQSFQSLSRKMRASPSSGEQAKKATLDALWRICLVAKNNSVASHAMNDLLEIYSSIAEHSTEPNSMPIEPAQTESFGKRVYDCLTEVKACLDRRDSSAELAAERCLRILNAAIGESSNSMTTSTLIRLASIPSDKGIDEVAKMLPHGMRGQSYYTKVGVLVKRTTQSQGQNAYQDRDTANSNQGRNGSTHRFTLDVHPLETLSSIKAKVGTKCQCPNSSVKPISITGRASSNGGRTGNDSNLNTVPEDMVVDELGIAPGCELVFIIADRQNAQQSMNHNTAMSSRNTRPGVMNELFRADSDDFADKLFNTLLGILDSLPGRKSNEMSDGSQALSDSHYLVWELIFAMPTNASISSQVFAAASIDSARVPPKSQDAMEIDSRHSVKWSSLLNMDSFHRSVYVLLAIDAFLQPAVEVLSSLPKEQRLKLEDETKEASILFRQGFIDSGGLDAVVKFFSFSEESPAMSQSMTRLGNAVVLRILKCCLFGDCQFARKSEIQPNDLDEAGKNVLNSLADAKGLLRSLTSMVVADSGISSSAVSDVLKLLHLLLKSDETAQNFIALPNNIAQKFLVALLLWEGGSESSRSEISSALKVRKNTRDAVLSTPILSTYALSWLRNAFDSIDVTSDSTAEYFELLESLVSGEHPDRIATVSKSEMAALATAVCKKLASCPRPASDALAVIDFSTGVLCGCLSLLRALIESSAHNGILLEGTRVLLQEFHAKPWSESMNSEVKPDTDDACLLDLMGVIFDAFLSPGGATSVVAICCDKPSRQRGFDVVVSAARHCTNGNGYNGLVHRINDIISSAAPYLKHRWGQSVNSGEVGTRHGRTTSKYSGLRNQGCTCYMNSFLQQMFMRPELRKSLCSASLPASVRASGAIMSARGAELVGKKVSMQWENGNSYDAQVEAFDENTGMHTIRYVPIVLATIAGTNHQQLNPEEINKLPPIFPDEFFLSEGRPGKETGVFEDVAIDSATDGGNSTEYSKDKEVEETEDEANSRRLMEEVQRTFIHLEEGSRGRCFDPRALVEACACLKLEFDVWQQNDASEFATKLLDRLEISLKKWAPEHFHYLHHTFGLKQTKQKICKECGLKVQTH